MRTIMMVLGMLAAFIGGMMVHQEHGHDMTCEECSTDAECEALCPEMEDNP